MSTINATINIGDDSAQIVNGLLGRFSKGQRVRVELTDEPVAPAQVPDLEEFTKRVDAALQKLSPSPWETAEEALRDLREGERD